MCSVFTSFVFQSGLWESSIRLRSRRARAFKLREKKRESATNSRILTIARSIYKGVRKTENNHWILKGLRRPCCIRLLWMMIMLRFNWWEIFRFVSIHFSSFLYYNGGNDANNFCIQHKTNRTEQSKKRRTHRRHTVKNKNAHRKRSYKKTTSLNASTSEWIRCDRIQAKTRNN